MTGSVRIDGAALDRYLRGPSGPVMRDLQRRTRNVQLKAKELVPKRSHELERNIVTRFAQDGRGLIGRVIAGEQLDDARAVWNEVGTRGHRIEAKRPGGVLAFSVKGKRVFRRAVWHPGTRGVHYMERALDEARR